MGTATRVQRLRLLRTLALSVSSVGSWALQQRADVCRRHHNNVLSVSSVGSWALQQYGAVDVARHAADFQYPRSDRGHCNHALPGGPSGGSAFSILGRIVGTATSVFPLNARFQSFSFQYPRSDRGHCNFVLSRDQRARGSFSILGRIVGTATSYEPGHLGCPPPFQYPRSDRGHCNLRMCEESAARGNLFQYPRSDRGHCNRHLRRVLSRHLPAFSILGRIVGTATLDPSHQVADVEDSFSILGRIVGTATRNSANWGVTRNFFQYPRSDRGHCNPIASAGKNISSELSVSSVGSWALQPVRSRRARGRALRFQYPRSDRGHCNPLNARFQSFWVELSVSSVGSWALQPSHHSPTSRRVRAFSILGRIVGTATGAGAVYSSISTHFQYPRSDRGHCNSSSSASADPFPTLSVSSVGSWALQLSFFPTFVSSPTSFSILGRIVGTATNLVVTNAYAPQALSVSSVGSWALQHLNGLRRCDAQ